MSLFSYSTEVFSTDVIGVEAAYASAWNVEQYRGENQAEWRASNEPYCYKTACLSERLHKRLERFQAHDMRRLVAHLEEKTRACQRKSRASTSVMAAFRYDVLWHRYGERARLARFYLGRARGATMRTEPSDEHYVLVSRKTAIDVGTQDLDAWDTSCEADYPDHEASSGNECATCGQPHVWPFHCFYYFENGAILLCDACWAAGRQREALERAYEWNRVSVNTARHTKRFRKMLQILELPPYTPQLPV